MSVTAVGNLPANVDLALYQGDDFQMTVAVFDPAQEPVDLTGYTAQSQIKTQPGGQLLADFTCVIDANNIHLVLPHAAAAAVVGRASWDVQVTDPAGVITTLAYGLVRPVPEVTT